MKQQKGFAAILIVFVLGMVSLFIGTGLVLTGYNESLMGRSTGGGASAFYVANSGIEEAIFKISRIVGYGDGSTESFSLPVKTGTAQVSVTGSEKQRTIVSVGKIGTYLQKIRAVVENTSLVPGFLYAIQAGAGGMELRNNTVIVGKGSTDGNVYSNSSIKGAKNDFFTSTGVCKTSASAIHGSAWAVTSIDKISPTDSGVCIAKDAYASDLLYCYVNGTASSPKTPSSNCTIHGSKHTAPAPTPIPLPDMNVSQIKNYLTNKGTVFNGNCTADGSGGAADCTYGTKTIGNMIITGNLTVPQNSVLKFSGPAWVQGSITFQSNLTVGLTSDITSVSQIVIADKFIQSDSNVTFQTNGSAFLLFLSTYDPKVTNPSIPDICTDTSISLSSNTNSVLFYATKGCLTVTANSNFHGAILGEKILISNNSTVEYDPALASAIFGITKSGGWQVQSFSRE